MARQTDDRSPERIAKLPVWAQDFIGGLERSVAYHKRRAEEIAQELPSNVCFDVYDDAGPKFLPNDSQVAFLLTGDPEDWQNRVLVRIRDGELEIQAGDGLYVKPQVSNVISVGIVKR